MAGTAIGVAMTGKATLDNLQDRSRHSLLDALEPDEWAKLAAFARREIYKADEVIFRKGDPGHSMMTVLRGRIKISSSSGEGKEVVLALLGQGEVLGEMAVLEGKPRSADATALEASELMVVHRRDFIPFLERNPRICIRLLGIFSARLRRTSALVEDRRFLNFPSRLAKMLLDLAMADGREVADGMRIDFKMSQKTVGALLGASRESVNKQLAAWQSEGLVKMGRGFIVLTRPEDLARIVEL
jgi:CRP-like cAMP-binding protein